MMWRLHHLPVRGASVTAAKLAISRTGRTMAEGGTDSSASGEVPKTVVRTSKTGEKFTFFYGKDCVFSQWYSAEFRVNDVEYNCAEQYMMHQKAVLFKDETMAKKILKSHDPKEQKAMGRMVTNFDPDVWNKNCKDIVNRGNIAKFSQNADLKSALLSTAGTSMVEASPRDRIWGIGLGAKNPKATDRKQWRGRNWLGQVLTQVREELETEKKPHGS